MFKFRVESIEEILYFNFYCTINKKKSLNEGKRLIQSNLH